MADQSVTIDLTVGDTGITLSGTIKHPALKGVSSLSGFSLTVSLLHADAGADFFTNKAATLGALDSVKGTLGVSYRLTAGDIGTPGLGKARWALTLPDGGVIHAPGSRDHQTYYRTNP